MGNSDWVTRRVANNNYATGFLRALFGPFFLVDLWAPKRRPGRPRGSKDSYKRTRRY